MPQAEQRELPGRTTNRGPRSNATRGRLRPGRRIGPGHRRHPRPGQIARTGREPARSGMLGKRSWEPAATRPGLSARRAPTATWSEAGHGGIPASGPLRDRSRTLHASAVPHLVFSALTEKLLPVYAADRATPALARPRPFWCTSPHPLTCGFPKSPWGRMPCRRYRRRSHPGRYHTDRQPSEAAQDTARWPGASLGIRLLPGDFPGHNRVLGP